MPTTPPVSGYILWLDSSQITGLADNAPLTIWHDLSGHGNDVSPVSTSNYAYYEVAGSPFPYPAPIFNIFTGYATASSVTVAQPFTWYVVSYPTFAGSPITSIYTLLATGGAPEIFMDPVSSSYSMLAGSNRLVDGGPNYRAPWVYYALFNGASSVLRVLNPVTGSSTSPGSGGMASLIFVGNDGSNVNGWLGYIAEVLIYPFAVTGTQDAAVTNYLAGKWGFLVSLPPSSFSIGPVIMSVTPSTYGDCNLGPLTTHAFGTSLGGGAIALSKVTVLE